MHWRAVNSGWPRNMSWGLWLTVTSDNCNREEPKLWKPIPPSGTVWRHSSDTANLPSEKEGPAYMVCVYAGWKYTVLYSQGRACTFQNVTWLRVCVYSTCTYCTRQDLSALCISSTICRATHSSLSKAASSLVQGYGGDAPAVGQVCSSVKQLGGELEAISLSVVQVNQDCKSLNYHITGFSS